MPATIYSKIVNKVIKVFFVFHTYVFKSIIGYANAAADWVMAMPLFWIKKILQLRRYAIFKQMLADVESRTEQSMD